MKFILFNILPIFLMYRIIISSEIEAYIWKYTAYEYKQVKKYDLENFDKIYELINYFNSASWIFNPKNWLFWGIDKTVKKLVYKRIEDKKDVIWNNKEKYGIL